MHPREAMTDALVGDGVLTDPAWEDAFRAVPRHAFIPDQATVGGDRIDRHQDPDGWMRACYTADEAVVTQTDDGAPEGLGVPTSSASAPTVVALMLQALDVFDGARVLEIGAGTGWNAALLCERVGSGNVTTVEIDQDIAVTARRNLHRAGFTPTVAWVDGEQGFPLNAPYDRVISTASVRTVPAAWIRQTVPGGRIVTPWAPGLDTGALLVLHVHGDGTASGRFGVELGFMALRGQRDPETPPPDFGEEAAGETTTDVDGEELMFGAAAFPLRVLMPGVRVGMRADHVWLGRNSDGSWARVYLGSAEHRVEFGGTANLWAGVEHAWAWWQANGRPGSDRFGLTVDGGVQRVWLDDPGNVIGTA